MALKPTPRASFDLSMPPWLHLSVRWNGLDTDGVCRSASEGGCGQPHFFVI